MTTLEKLIDTLRGIDGSVTLDEVQVRELVAWFETARRSIAETATYAVELRDDLTRAAVDEAVEAEREECAAYVAPRHDIVDDRAQYAWTIRANLADGLRKGFHRARGGK